MGTGHAGVEHGLGWSSTPAQGAGAIDTTRTGCASCSCRFKATMRARTPTGSDSKTCRIDPRGCFVRARGMAGRVPAEATVAHPLAVGAPGAWLDVGVLSGGNGCTTRGYLDLYARVDRIQELRSRHESDEPAGSRRTATDQRTTRRSFALTLHARPMARQPSEILFPVAPPRRPFSSGPGPRRCLPARTAQHQAQRQLHRHCRQSRWTQHGHRPAAATTPTRNRLTPVTKAPGVSPASRGPEAR